MTATPVRAPATHAPPQAHTLPPPAARERAHARFAAALDRDRTPGRPRSPATPCVSKTDQTTPGSTVTTTGRGPHRQVPPREESAAKGARRVDPPREAEREPSELLAFRPLPQILQPPPMTIVTPPAPRGDLGRLADQLVTRLRVGRSREGAAVELRLALGDRELDVRLVETPHGLELHTSADDALRDAMTRELTARGLTLAT